MIDRRLLLPTLLLFLTACAPAPRIAPRMSYDPPRWERMTDLEEKARLHEESTLAMVNSSGMLLYYVFLPWDESLGTSCPNYQVSHHLADAPAWHGYLMAALGFKAAVLTRELSANGTDRRAPENTEREEALAKVNADLRRLTGAYRHFYEMSGEPGLLGNSMLPDYRGETSLPWMVDPNEDKPWVRSETTGEWWRDGLNKGHFNLAVFGCAIPLALDRRGEIELEASTRKALTDALVPMVARLVRNDYSILDRNGRPTQHSDLGPNLLILPNGFHRTISLQALASASPYDEGIAAEYERRIEQWIPGLAWSMSVSGCWTRWRGHWNRAANVSSNDAQHFVLAACSLLLQEGRPEYAEEVERGIEGWWTFMRHELNVPFMTVYAALVEDGPERRETIMAPAIDELRDFPVEKILGDPDDESVMLVNTPGVVQPIANRRVDSNYWKSDPYRKMTGTEERTPRRRVAGMDYLLAYWMACYFDLLDRGERLSLRPPPP